MSMLWSANSRSPDAVSRENSAVIRSVIPWKGRRGIHTLYPAARYASPISRNCSGTVV